MIDDTGDNDMHKRVWGLLPWFVNGRLSREESQAIERHLADCRLCRQEREVQARIHDAIRPSATVAFASEASYRKLMAQIDAADTRVAQRPGAQPWMKWLVAAVVVESIALVTWGAWAFSGASRATGSDAHYVTVSDAMESTPARAESQVRVVFASHTTLRDLQSLLRSVDAQVIDGPTESGVYTIALDRAAGLESDRVSALRASSHVRFAELVQTNPSSSP